MPLPRHSTTDRRSREAKKARMTCSVSSSASRSTTIARPHPPPRWAWAQTTESLRVPADGILAEWAGAALFRLFRRPAFFSTTRARHSRRAPIVTITNCRNDITEVSRGRRQQHTRADVQDRRWLSKPTSQSPNAVQELIPSLQIAASRSQPV
jgi:hypothetical protein